MNTYYDQKMVFKQGATFGGSFVLADNGSPITGMAGNLSSQVRDADGNLLGTAIIAETSTPGTYTLTIGDTTGWTVDDAYWDIKYADSSGHVLKTQTVQILIQKEVTT